MKLLFDANLSPKLAIRLNDLFSGSTHVQEIGLTTSDELIWKYSLANDLVIVTKDDDFRTKALLVAPPGKVILLTLMNCETASVELLFRQEHREILEFIGSDSETLLVIP